MKKIIVLLVLLQMAAVCSAKDCKTYMQETRRELESNNDDQIVKVAKTIYDFKVETQGDEIARSIMLDEVMAIVRNRQSHKVIQESGILDLQYNRINVKKLSDQEILDIANYLKSKLPAMDLDSPPPPKSTENLTAEEKAEWRLRSLRGGAFNIVGAEAESRDSCRNFWRGIGNLTGNLVGATCVGVSAAAQQQQAYNLQRQAVINQQTNRSSTRGTSLDPIHVKVDDY